MSRTSAIIIIMLVAAWFAAGATAVRSASRIWLRHWTERRLRGSGGSRVEPLLDRPQRLLVTAGAVAAVLFFSTGLILGAAPLTPAQWVLQGSVLLVSFLIFGQLVPRAAGRRWATTLVPVLIPPLRLLDLVVWPVASTVRRLVRPSAPSASVEEEHDDLEELLREGELEGVGEPDEIELITGVVQFGAKAVRDVMTPRDSVFAVDEALGTEGIARAVAHSHYSRVPVYAGSLDNIRGMVHAFDVLRFGRSRTPGLRSVMDADGTSRCDELLFQMLRQRRHFAAVRDASGRLEGIITLEDLLEELVGEIQDEHDDPPAPEPSK
jgi:putative hemolysin